MIINIKNRKKVFSSLVIFTVVLTMTFVPLITYADIVKCENGPECGFTELMNTIRELVKVMVSIAIAAVAIAISYAGFLYLTSGGDTGKVSKAHSIFTTSATGFIITLLAYVLIQLLFNVLGVKPDFNPFT